MRRKLIVCACVIYVSVLLINNITESVPLNLFPINKSYYATFTVMCYNVKCSDSLYRNNQVKIANVILAELPDIVFLCEFNKFVSRQLDSIMTSRGGYRAFYRSGMNGIFYSRYAIDSISSIPYSASHPSSFFALPGSQ